MEPIPGFFVGLSLFLSVLSIVFFILLCRDHNTIIRLRHDLKLKAINCETLVDKCQTQYSEILKLRKKTPY